MNRLTKTTTTLLLLNISIDFFYRIVFVQYIYLSIFYILDLQTMMSLQQFMWVNFQLLPSKPEAGDQREWVRPETGPDPTVKRPKKRRRGCPVCPKCSPQ